MFFKDTYQKIHKLRVRHDEELSERLKRAKEEIIPFRWLDAKVFFLRIAETISRFFVILFFDPADSFDLLYKTSHVQEYPISFTTFKRVHSKVRVFSFTGGAVIVVVSITVGLFLNILTGIYRSAEAATFTWTQTSWNTLVSDTTGADASGNPPVGWDKYTATTTNIVGGTDISLQVISTSTTITVPYFSN